VQLGEVERITLTVEQLQPVLTLCRIERRIEPEIGDQKRHAEFK
jgi:hypothetical protein